MRCSEMRYSKGRRGDAPAIIKPVEFDIPPDVLRRGFSPQEARSQLDTAIDWGRYAELFAYDDQEGTFYRESPGVASRGNDG